MLKFPALLLVAVIAAVPLMGQGMSPVPVPHEQPAGCHQHGGTPAPLPVSYRCCLAGHDSAILPVSALQPELADFTSPVEQPSQVLISGATPRSFRHPAPSAADPPNIVPLRV